LSDPDAAGTLRGVTAPRSPSDVIAAALAVYVGPDTARRAVRTFADRVLGRRADEVTFDEAIRLVESFRPMLRTLLGEVPAEHVLSELREALR
jgi:hypothetical protein